MKHILILIAVVTLCSCKSTKVVTVERVTHDTLTQVVSKRDSIYLHDSIYQSVFVKGDTVTITKDRWHTAYRDRVLHDSIYIVKTDTVPVPYKVEIEKRPSFWHDVGLVGVGIFLACVIALLIFSYINEKK